MASSTLAGLTASGALTGTELFYSDNGTTDVKVTANQIKTFAGAGGVSGGAANQVALFGTATTITAGLGLGANTVLGSVTGTGAPIALSQAQLTAMANLFSTSTTTQGMVPGSNGATTLFLRGDGTWAAAGGGASLPLVGTGATVTTNTPLLDLTETWNAAATRFYAIRLNITNTAAAVNSPLIDLQTGGQSAFQVGPFKNTSGAGNAWDGDYIAINTFAAMNSPGTSGVTLRLRTVSNFADWQLDQVASAGAVANNSFTIQLGTIRFFGGAGNIYCDPNAPLSTVSSSSSVPNMRLGDPTGGSTFIGLWNEDNNGYNLSLRTSTHPCSFRVYNTGDVGLPVNNYERGVFDWTTTANTLTIGMQAAGTGTVRNVSFVAGASTFFAYSGGEVIIPNNFSFGITANANPGAGFDVSLNRQASAVWGIGGPSPGATGWMQWAGQARVTANFSNATTTLNPVTGLTVNVQAGRTYDFEAHLHCTCAAAGGVQASIGGTCTATNIVYDGMTFDASAVKGQARATALATAVGSTVTTGTTPYIHIKGTITVNAAGTLLVNFAENTTNATASVVLQGSVFRVFDAP